MNLIERLREAKGQEVEVEGSEIRTRCQFQGCDLVFTHPDNPKKGQPVNIDESDLDNEYVIVKAKSPIAIAIEREAHTLHGLCACSDAQILTSLNCVVNVALTEAQKRCVMNEVTEGEWCGTTDRTKPWEFATSKAGNAVYEIGRAIGFLKVTH